MAVVVRDRLPIADSARTAYESRVCARMRQAATVQSNKWRYILNYNCADAMQRNASNDVVSCRELRWGVALTTSFMQGSNLK